MKGTLNALIKKGLVVALLIGNIAVLHGCNTSDGKASDGPLTLNVMSYNMRFEPLSGGDDPIYTWENRMPGIVESFETYDADIVGTQELRKWQQNELMESLGSDWSVVGEPRLNSGDEHSSIVYRNDRYEYLEGDTLWLSETPDKAGSKSWDSAHPRIVTYGRFKALSNEDEFYVFNTHLDHESAMARKEGLAIIVDRMLEVEDHPILFTGDLNMYLDSENMEAIKAHDDKFKDTFTPFSPEFDEEGLTSHGFNGGTEGKPIDFIFYSVNHFELLDTEIIRDRYEDRYYYSDHYPVFSQLELKEDQN